MDEQDRQPFKSSRARQADFIAECRRESVLGDKFVLGATAPPHPEIGPNVADYFRAKHALGKLGTFYPLFRLALGRTG